MEKKERKIRLISGLQNALLFVCSFLLFFALAEVVTRLVWKQPAHSLYKVTGQYRFIPNSETSYKTSEFEFTMKTNRFGRRDWEWTDLVMKDPCNIVFIGDSFVFGYGVNDADTVPTLLERELAEQGKKLEVFNFGGGQDFFGYRFLTREAIEMGIHARTILIGIFLGNDFICPCSNKEEPVVKGGQVLWQPVDRRAGRAKSLSRGRIRTPELADSAFYQFLKVRISSSPLFTSLLFRIGKWLHREIYPTSTGYIFLREWTKDQEALFYSFLNQSLDIAKIASENERDVVFVIFPNKAQVENAADLTSSIYDAGLPDKRILDFCDKHGLRCLDLLPPLRSAYDRGHRPLYFPGDRHLNAQGNRLAAAAVCEYLRSQTLLCNHGS
jgi:hypothetical protein